MRVADSRAGQMQQILSSEMNGCLTVAPAQATNGWTAVVLAGQRPGVDPLAEAFGQTHKALVQLGGQSMLDRVLRTLLASPSIERIAVLAQAPDALFVGDVAWAAKHARITPLASIGGIAQSIAHVAGGVASPWPVLVTTADHPLLTPDIVESFLAQADDTDIAVGAVERKTVLARFPASKRTWLKFADGAYSGANLFALRNARTDAALTLWAAAEQDRKQAFRLFLHFGPMLAARAITRTISFRAAISAAAYRLGVTARLVALDMPEAAIDVDKPSDHQLAETILRQRVAVVAGQASAHTRLSIFDLDRTLTRKPTYTAFLVFAALRLSPWRLLLAPAVLGCMLAYLAGLITRRRVKELEQQLLLGRIVPRRKITILARRFAERIGRNGIYTAGIAQINQERAEGRRVIMASAANSVYLDAIAAHLGIDEVVGTRSLWNDDLLLPTIDGENCYGRAKRDMLAAYLAANCLSRAQTDIRFFSDHVSDLPTFEWVDEPIAVNPSRKLRRLASYRRWPIVLWR
ncbi:HAD-IB family phosphatase [Sphingobium yanoikuyae]|uniref:HAD-IB family phosphatase n=1 Tax=Sphingobium yanoikuyae TaxID=13690 RepID=A0AA43BCE8_SPHYA|nr:HAD-IB family phosphatase [Sphingobium yanoikuyae]MDH2134278.1 HAD-IB family phosphatase [Sphingobium yanoikuyae]MDH2151525.1 HAD-IB family phosphatase [Sphingobium yanoikuyae]MDH2169682.1 HAD-IB family phosphatase [Sphingobium yanoikuyae]